MKQPRPDRVALYRKHAGEARSEADKMKNARLRATMIEVADTWKRLADREEAMDPTPADEPLPTVVSDKAPPSTGTDDAS